MCSWTLLTFSNMSHTLKLQILKNEKNYCLHFYIYHYKLLNTSLKTTFLVVLSLFPSSLSINIFNPFLSLTLDKATYNWPWLKTGFGRYKPTFENDCPWLLFMVIAKQTITGNCLRYILNGNLVFDSVSSISGMNTLLPVCVPVMISASITWLPNCVTRSLIPLHSPNDWSIFLTRITGTSTFSLISWFGTPEYRCVCIYIYHV